MELLPKTKLTEAALQSRWRHVWIVDILIALAIFFAAQMVESAILTPAMLVWVFTSVDFSTLSADNPAVMLQEISTLLSAQPDWLSLLMLFATAVVIILCIVYCTKLERRTLQSLGFRGKSPAKEFLLGYGIGLGMFVLAWGICLLTGTARAEGFSSNRSWMLVPFFLAFLVQGLSEEILCRGFLMQTLSTRYTGLAAIGWNALFFALLHLLNAGITLLAFLNLFLFGVFASVYLWKRGNIYGVAAIHAAWNFTQGNLLGIRVSGNVLGPSVLSTTLPDSGTWMNGGAFGLEGGLAVTIVLITGIAILLAVPVRKDARVDV